MAESDLDYAKLTGRLALTVADGPDAGENPDIVWCDGGTVEIQPLTTYTKVAGAAAGPFTAGNSVIVALIDADGYLTRNGQNGVWLVDLTSPKVNPQIGADKATHQIVFKNITAQGTPVAFQNVTVRITADGPNGDGVNDLTLIAPVATAPAQPIYRGEQGVSITDATINSVAELVLTMSDGSTINAGQVPAGDDGVGVTSLDRTTGTGQAGATDTYTVSFTDGSTSTFQITNGTNGSDGADGSSISGIARTAGDGTPGTIDTYTVTLTTGSTFDFNVTNGKDGLDGTGAGDTIGPASSDNLAIARFDGTTGKALKDSAAFVGDDGVILAAGFYGDASQLTNVLADSITESATRKVLTATERTKLGGVATAATANSTDAALRDRTTHTGAQPSSTISDFIEAVQDTIGGSIAAGANMTQSYNDTTGVTTLSVVAPGDWTNTDPEVVRDTIGGALAAGTNIAIAVNDAGDTITISVTGLGNAATKNVGTTAGTVAAGDDSRLTSLGTAATKNTGTASGDIPLLSAGGVLPIARLATGTPDGTKFVRDDGTLVAPPGAALPPTPLLVPPALRTATNVSTYSTTSTSPVDVDAANLVQNVTYPASGKIKITMTAACGGGGFSSYWSLRVGTTNVVGSEGIITNFSAETRATHVVYLTGTPGSTVAYKWAFRTDNSTSANTIYYGGPTEFSATYYGYMSMETSAV